MSSLLNVREVADEMLAKAKVSLRQVGFLDPVGYILEATGKLTVMDLKMDDEPGLKKSMQRLWQTSQDLKAVGVFAIMEAVYRRVLLGNQKPSKRVGKSRLGENLNANGHPRDCICMRVVVPDQTPTVVMVPYHKDNEGHIKFEVPVEAPEDFLGPTPSLGKQQKGSSN